MYGKSQYYLRHRQGAKRPDKKKANPKIGLFSLYLLVGTGGFEPPTPCTPCTYATRLRYAPTR